MIKVSAVKPEHQAITAPTAVFQEQEDFIAAFKRGELNRDAWSSSASRAVGQRPPELHNLPPSISVLLDRGFKVALVTDGRMSGASGKTRRPSASPGSRQGGALAYVRTAT